MTNFNQQHQKVNSQINIGSVHVHVYATRDVAGMLRKAIGHLQVRHYDEALKMLDLVLEEDGTIAAAYYYRALVLLKGKRPRYTVKSVAGRMERDLHAAVSLEGRQAHYFYLWAMLKHDFYRMNGFGVQPPSENELMENAARLPLDVAGCRELLLHTNAEKCPIWDWLHDQL